MLEGTDWGSSLKRSTRGWFSSFDHVKHVMVAGLRSSGKTSLMVKIQAWNHLYDDAEALPLPAPTKETRMFTFDMGQMETKFVEVPSSLYPITSPSVQALLGRVNAVVFMIDSTDPIRIPQAQIQLKELLNSGMTSDRILVLFTKTDHPRSLKNEELFNIMLPDCVDISNFSFERITLNSTTRALSILREFLKYLPKRIVEI